MKYLNILTFLESKKLNPLGVVNFWSRIPVKLNDMMIQLF